MFLIVTGSPGSSKTLNVISQFKSVTDRPIYYRGITLTDEGKSKLGWIELSDDQARDWPDHCPSGSIVIIDEAQEIWPVRPAGSPVPSGLTALEKHRHKGYDVVFLTQHPMLLHTHARKICNEHHHYSRPFGTKRPIRYHSGSGFVNPSDTKELKFSCTQKRIPLDTTTYPLYKSAEIHTHKSRVPFGVIKMWVLIALVLGLVGFCVYWLISVISGDKEGLTHRPQSLSSPSNQSSLSLNTSAISPVSSRRDVDWSTALVPEIDGIPYTAPLYNDAATKVKSVPRVAACIASKSRCQCFTQQATVIHGVRDQVCRQHVKQGTFDHMHEENRERGGGSRAREPAPRSTTDNQENQDTALSRLQRAIAITKETRLTAIN